MNWSLLQKQVILKQKNAAFIGNRRSFTSTFTTSEKRRIGKTKSPAHTKTVLNIVIDPASFRCSMVFALFPNPLFITCLYRNPRHILPSQYMLFRFGDAVMFRAPKGHTSRIGICQACSGSTAISFSPRALSHAISSCNSTRMTMTPR